MQNYNIKTGASYFASTLKNNGGDLLLSIGEYNGWYQGLTVVRARLTLKALLTRQCTRPRLPPLPRRIAVAARTTSISTSYILACILHADICWSLFQFMNGWVQNVNAYDMALGQYHNLDVCSD